EMSSIAFDKIIGGALNAVVSAQNTSSLTTVDFIKNVGFQNDENGNTVKPVYVDFKYPKEVAPYRAATPDSYRVEITGGGKGYDEDELNKGGYTVDGLPEVKLSFTVDSNGAISAVNIIGGEDKLMAKLKGQDSVNVTAKTATGEGANIAIKKVAGSKATPAKFQDMTLQVPLLTIVPIPFIRVATTDIELNVKINSIYNSSNTSDTNVDASVSASAKKKGFFFSGNINMNASVSHQQKKSTTEEVKKEYSLNIKIHAVQDDLPAGMSRILDVLEESIVPKLSGGNEAGEKEAGGKEEGGKAA
ncbi:MAG: DUF2589 domain-containing protein, partial [Clostridia bacterium]|nr:DUF2589 domain-containing protein [Clostridia bacterium]